MAREPARRDISLGALGIVSALTYEAAGPPRAVLVLAHGAGADQRHRGVAGLAAEVASEGVSVVTFNFPYAEAGRKSPDRPPVLEQAWREVVNAVGGEAGEGVRLVIGGRSMGGRIASQVLAGPMDPGLDRVSGLVLLAYPLHPPGRPGQLRTAHLPALRVPVLLVHGTRDAFGTREEIAPVFTALPTRVDIEWVDGGDHGFAVPRAQGRTEAQVRTAIARRVAGWILG